MISLGTESKNISPKRNKIKKAIPNTRKFPRTAVYEFID